MTQETHHVAKYKKNIVKEFKELIKQYPIIATVNMENMPTAQLQKMRRQLRGKVVLRMSKRRLMKIAIEESKDVKKGVEELNNHLKGMPALIFTKENPFKLYKILSKSKTNAPAKTGQVAPKDILIQAGPTPFAPGPVISELSMIGLKTGVEGGKVAIKQDKVVVKEGEKISDKVASILLRLGITPMEIGLDLVAAYENGTIFTKDILAIDEKEFMQRIIRADSEAFNLGVEIKYPCTRVLEYLIGKAFNESKALALGQNIMCSLVAEDLLSKAEREMLSLKEAANIKIAGVEVKEETKVEEKPEFNENQRFSSIQQVESIEKEEKPKEETTEEKVKKLVEKMVKKEPKAEDLIKGEKKKEVKKEDELPKVEDLVKKTKEFVERKKIKAEDLIEEAKKADESKEIAEEIVRRLQKGKQIKKEKEDVPSIAELAVKKKKEQY